MCHRCAARGDARRDARGGSHGGSAGGAIQCPGRGAGPWPRRPEGGTMDESTGTSDDANARGMSRIWAWALAGVLLLALALRLAYLREFAALPIFDQPIGDSAAHLKRAAAIARGSFLPA